MACPYAGAGASGKVLVFPGESYIYINWKVGWKKIRIPLREREGDVWVESFI